MINMNIFNFKFNKSAHHIIYHYRLLNVRNIIKVLRYDA